MDPNQCLKDLLQLNTDIKDFLEDYDWLKHGEAPKHVLEVSTNYTKEELDMFMGDVNNLVEHIEDLNDWLKKGGFLPQAWVSNRHPQQTKT